MDQHSPLSPIQPFPALDPGYVSTAGMHSGLERDHCAPTFPVEYDGAEKQLVDFGSRFGVWWDPASRYLGVDCGGISSQREGKQFMAPLVRLGVWDVDTGRTLFTDPGKLAKRQIAGSPWGFVQEGEVDTLRLRVTVLYAEFDVVALQIELENRGESGRHVQLSLEAQSVGEDRNRSTGFHSSKRTGEVITAQTASPASNFQIRHEPDLEIVAGWRTDFGFSGEEERPGGFCVRSLPLSLPAGRKRSFSVYISAASCESGSAKPLEQLVRQRLQEAAKRSADELIREAIARWRDVFATLPLETLDPTARGVVHRAMMILLRNSIYAQPEQGYGRMMGPSHPEVRPRGTFPSRSSYEAFWVWDSAFQALGISQWDLELAKDNVRIMLHNQDSEGGLPFLHPDSSVPSAQPPLFGWVVTEIYEKEQQEDAERAREFLEEVYPKLALWNRWWFRQRDKNGNGVAEWGNGLESGWDDSPRWDNADGPTGWHNEGGAACYEAVDLNAYLIKDLRCLGRMAEELGLSQEGRDWREKADELAQRVVDVLYDAQDNLFYDTNFATGERHKLLTPASLLPLWAGVPLPEDQVRHMIETYLLSPEHFFGPYPFPTVSYQEPQHDAAGHGGYWRGPVWLNIAYFMIELLARHGYTKESREASRRIVEMVGSAGIHENYDAHTGRRGANSRTDFSWSAAMAIKIATGEWSQVQPPRYPTGEFHSPKVHIGVSVRDRNIYGREKEGGFT